MNAKKQPSFCLGRGSEEEDGEEGEREAVRKRMERKGEKGSEEDDYFNKFPREN